MWISDSLMKMQNTRFLNTENRTKCIPHQLWNLNNRQIHDRIIEEVPKLLLRAVFFFYITRSFHPFSKTEMNENIVLEVVENRTGNDLKAIKMKKVSNVYCLNISIVLWDFSRYIFNRNCKTQLILIRFVQISSFIIHGYFYAKIACYWGFFHELKL